MARGTSAPPPAAVGRGGHQWAPQPQRIKHRRTFGDVLRGFGAFLVLVLLLGAIPAALIRYIGWPLPHHVPSTAVFGEPITQQTLLHALAVIVWLAWAQFAACVAVELVAAKRGVGMPAKVPAAGPSQFLARQLVAALLMVTASAASFVPGLAHLGDSSAGAPKALTSATASAHAPATPRDALAGGAASVRGLPGATSAVGNLGNQSASTQLAVRAGGGITTLAGASAPAAPNGIKFYRVMPPAGRHHDSLWDIALRHLGDGRRYKEIFDLNKDRIQPDGSMLTESSLIRPGWILAMPADATGGDLISSTGLQALAPSPGPTRHLTTQSPPVQHSTAPLLPAPISPAPISPAPISPAPPHAKPAPVTGPPASGAPAAPTSPPGTIPPTSTGPVLASPPGTIPPTSTGPVTGTGPVTSTGPGTSTGPVTTAPGGPTSASPVPPSGAPTNLLPKGLIPPSTTGAGPAPGTGSGTGMGSGAGTGPASGPGTGVLPKGLIPPSTTGAGPAPGTSSGMLPGTGPVQNAASRIPVRGAAAPTATTADTATSKALPPGAAAPGFENADADTASLPKITDATVPPQAAAGIAQAAAGLIGAAPGSAQQNPAQAAAAPAGLTGATPAAAQSLAQQSPAQQSPAQQSPAQQTTAPRYPTQPSTAQLNLAQQYTAQQTGAPTARPVQTGPQPGTVIAGRDAARASSHRGRTASEEAQAPETGDRLLYGLAGSPLLAAGLLLALGRHRRRQLWHRTFGRRPAVATGDGAVAEESIRIGAGEVEVWFLDLALRGLSDGLIGRGGPLPSAYALKLRAEGVELLLTAPAGGADRPESQPPAPWSAAADGRSWKLERDRIGEIDADGAHRRFAPYPGMVTFGSQGPDRILLDLEEARGVIAVEGPADLRRAVLAALAVELSTNSWSDRMTVTLIGFPGDLTVLAPARIRHAKSLDEVLPALEAETAERRRSLAAAGLASVLDGRARSSHASSFTPHFILAAEEPHPAQLARLTELASGGARVGMGFVVAGTVPGATWQLAVDPDGRIAAPVLGIEATAQLLPEDQYAAVLGLFRAVCDVRGAQTAPAQVHQSVGYKGSLPDEPPSVYVRMLGPLEIAGAGPLDPAHAVVVREALVFLLHHRDGVHPRVLAAALYPRGTSAETAQNAIDRLDAWLGEDQHGRRNLQSDPDGRLTLGPSVWSDWDAFQSLQTRALYDPASIDPLVRNRLLGVALDLVRGTYLEDRAPGRYGWLAYEVAEAQVPALVADTALQLSEGLTAAGRAPEAIRAVRTGLLGSPDDEELWRGLLRAVAATADRGHLEETVEELYQRTWYVHGVKGLHPRTESLVDELLPGWRDLLPA
jgi:hypothetical protein